MEEQKWNLTEWERQQCMNSLKQFMEVTDPIVARLQREGILKIVDVSYRYIWLQDKKMKEPVEVSISETFTEDGKLYKVCPSEVNCRMCSFSMNEELCFKYSCFALMRKDKSDVVFVELSSGLVLSFYEDEIEVV